MVPAVDSVDVYPLLVVDVCCVDYVDVNLLLIVDVYLLYIVG